MTKTQAMVLFSGGQDFTVCLAWALSRFDRVETLGFDYGQRHATELAARPRLLSGLKAAFSHWAGQAGRRSSDPPERARAPSAAARSPEAMAIAMGHDGLPNTFVPGRNLMFLTAAAALGYRRGSPIWSAACARRIFPAIPIAATRRSRPRPKPCHWAWARSAHSYAADVHRQGRDLETGGRIWAASPGRPDRGRKRHLLRRRPRRIGMIGVMAAASAPPAICAPKGFAEFTVRA